MARLLANLAEPRYDEVVSIEFHRAILRDISAFAASTRLDSGFYIDHLHHLFTASPKSVQERI